MTEQGPIQFEDEQNIDVDAAPVIDASTTAMGMITTRTARRTGWLGRLFMAAFALLITMMVSLAFWDFTQNLLARNVLLGRAAFVLVITLVALALVYALREITSIWRLGRIDKLRQSIVDTHNSGSLPDALDLTKRVANIYKRRAEFDHSRWSEDASEQMDASALLDLTERRALSDFDAQASREIENRARQVAVVTAFVPLALADVIAVLVSNVGMIRKIAEIYGGRPGIIGGFRLFGRVATHLVATGAVAVGDDVIGSVMGGGLLTKLSRRFGEGVINAALTARVGIAAIEVCRPMPFHTNKRPSTAGILTTALAGFAGGKT